MKKTLITAALLSTPMASPSFAFDMGEINGTHFKIGGYIKAEGVFGDPDDGDSTFDGSARESRINFSASKEVEGHSITAFIEGDFYGGMFTATTYDWRLRHAYLKIDNLTLGQTWNGQFWAVAPLDGEMINFWGLGFGTINGNGGRVRRDLVVHYEKAGFRFTAQDPVYLDASSPDLVASYMGKFGKGHGYSIAVTGREVENGDDSDYGAGISLATKLALSESGQIRASIYSGEGMGVYSGACVGGAWSGATEASCDVEDGDLVSQTGYAIAYRHQITPLLRSTLRYGEVNVDDAADTSLDLTTLNLIYTYLPGLDLGIEVRDQNLTTLPLRPAGKQLELMARYNF